MNHWSKFYCSACGFTRYYRAQDVPQVCPRCGANQVYVDNGARPVEDRPSGD